MEYLFSSLIGYLLGSFPTAYLLLKKIRNLDITTQGSGNVGAMNTFDVTKSKALGAIVLLIDALKGLLSVYLSLLIFPVNFIYPALALFFAVFSHCYNPWLKFKGGRGLTTATGGTALLFPVLPIVWCIIWLIIFLMKKDIIFANAWASGATLVILFSTAEIVFKYSFPQAESIPSLILFSTGLMMIIFVKHLDPLMEILNNKKKILKRQR
ncbi:MAG: glycerol-3-phosphate acyltransferase [Ignavibacteria bacterium]|nr:glycerol-3-phosphate acyltransferase [Ignavibacteria bacterium]